MMHIERRGQYNEIPGTVIAYAGPGSNPGALDLAVMAAADATGLSINARRSKGVRRYGQYDDRTRRNWEWQSDNIGHIEFSPLHNLAEYGWREFTANPTNAQYLGWPLHAIGDAMIPHHLVGTMSKGHAPFESAMGRKWKEITDGTHSQILTNGFKWWNRYCNSSQMTSVSPLIQELASENWTLVGEWAWDDRASVKQQLGNKEEAVSRYTGNPDFVFHMRPIVANSNGAALATLICASKVVPEDIPITAELKCPDGFGYCPRHQCGFQCVDGYEGPVATTEESVDFMVPQMMSPPIIDIE